jgi:predicted enzyme related to lactoylglutathione lyase
VKVTIWPGIGGIGEDLLVAGHRGVEAHLGDGAAAGAEAGVVPMAEGSGLVLDSKGFAGPHDKKPAFHFNTSDVHAAREQAMAAGASEVGPVTDGVFFTFKDPDGNLLMVADVPPAPRS